VSIALSPWLVRSLLLQHLLAVLLSQITVKALFSSLLKVPALYKIVMFKWETCLIPVQVTDLQSESKEEKNENKRCRHRSSLNTIVLSLLFAVARSLENPTKSS